MSNVSQEMQGIPPTTPNVPHVYLFILSKTRFFVEEYLSRIERRIEIWLLDRKNNTFEKFEHIEG